MTTTLTRRRSTISGQVRLDANDSPEAQGPHNSGTSSKPNWFQRTFERLNPTLYLDNTASVARDHLANERTFLAWLRTSLSFISIGVAITQLFRLNAGSNFEQNMGKPLGVVFILLGIIFLCFGFLRYFHSQTVMTKGQFPASRGTVILGTIFTMLSLAGCLLVILIVDAGV